MGLAFWRVQHEAQARKIAEARAEEREQLKAEISPLKALERPSTPPKAETPAPEPKPVQEPLAEAKNPLQSAVEKARAQRRASVKTQRSRDE